MIEGLKVTIPGAELRQLCEDRAAHHAARVEAYQGQVDSMKSAQVEPMQYSGGDPIKALEDKRDQHQTQGDEMTFIAAHIDTTESYLLDRSDLERIGVVRGSRYY